MNKELSKELGMTGSFIPKHCYDNVFDNIGKIGSKFKDDDIKIMFCYVSVGRMENVYTRHACFYLNGEAIDPTIATLYGESIFDNDIKYIPFKIMSVDEYFVLISREHRADLFKTFKEVEAIKSIQLLKEGIALIG